MPWGSGYGGLFHGLVVDMIYFPLFFVHMAGVDTYSVRRPGVFVFDPVFNIADAAITIGMGMIIFFYAKYLGSEYIKNEQDKGKKA